MWRTTLLLLEMSLPCELAGVAISGGTKILRMRGGGAIDGAGILFRLPEAPGLVSFELRSGELPPFGMAVSGARPGILEGLRAVEADMDILSGFRGRALAGVLV